MGQHRCGERIEHEVDPPHTELIIHQLGLSCSSRSVSTPSEKSKPGVDLSTVLNSADHILYRSATMRLCDLALDRPDEAFKRVARYLIGYGGLIQEFVRQNEEPSRRGVH